MTTPTEKSLDAVYEEIAGKPAPYIAGHSEALKAVAAFAREKDTALIEKLVKALELAEQFVPLSGSTQQTIFKVLAVVKERKQL